MLCGTGGGMGGKPLACAVTCAQVIPAALPSLKLAAFSRAVLSSTEFLITVISFWIFSVHLAVS
jgi:hypothetical protein